MLHCNYMNCSDEDSDDGKPQIAADEDFSSPEEEAAPVIVPQTTTTSKQSPQTQKKSPVVKSSPKILRSAKEVLLTDSESEDDEGPSVMVEKEDVDFDNDHMTKTKKQSTQPVKENIKDNLSIVPPKKPKNSGLMLEFDLSPAALSKVATKDESPKDSPDSSGRRKDSTKKKKRSKKTHHSKDKDENNPTTPSSVKADSAPSAAINSNDPFGAIAALDAWLNSDSTEAVRIMRVHVFFEC